MATKLTLNQSTSLKEVGTYFKENTRREIRARDLGGGKIELYVRKDSFKQFFTDKLRLEYFVKRDYQAAKNQILEIVKKFDPNGNQTISKISSPLNRQSLHFEAYALSKAIEDVQGQSQGSGKASVVTNTNKGPSKNPFKESQDAQVIVEDNFSAGYKDKTTKALLRSAEGQKEVSKIINAVEDNEDRKTLQQNFEALTKVLVGIDTKEYPTGVDYCNARDFSRAWLKELPGALRKLNSNVTSPTGSPANHESDLINRLTDFSKRIEKWNVPGTVDFQGGIVGDSHADLVIVDDSSLSSIFIDHSAGQKVPTFVENINSDYGATTLSGYSDVTVVGGSADGLKINYPLGQPIGSIELDTLYEEIGKKIDEKIKSATPESSKGYLTADQFFIVHLPILNPFKKTTLEQPEKDLVMKALMKAIDQWTKKHPGLRIRLELPEGIDELSLAQTAFDMSERGQIRAQNAKRNEEFARKKLKVDV